MDPLTPEKSRHQRRTLIALALAVLAVGATVFLLAYLLPCGGEPQAPLGPADGAPGPIADAVAQPALDTLAPVDLGPDRPPTPRGTRRITDQELHALQRRHRGLINACYQLAARRDTAMTPARVTITVELGDAGRVRSVAVDAQQARRLGGCLRRVVRGWRFSGSLRAQQVSFPIVRPR